MKVLITGGTGTVGKALISQNDNEYISISRNEENIAKLRREYPDVKCYVGNIEDEGLLLRVFKEVKPDVVVHAAAMKHIDLMETNPIAGCNVNVMGSLNVVQASLINDVPITIGISTDNHDTIITINIMYDSHIIVHTLHWYCFDWKFILSNTIL